MINPTDKTNKRLSVLTENPALTLAIGAGLLIGALAITIGTAGMGVPLVFAAVAGIGSLLAGSGISFFGAEKNKGTNKENLVIDMDEFYPEEDSPENKDNVITVDEIYSEEDSPENEDNVMTVNEIYSEEDLSQKGSLVFSPLTARIPPTSPQETLNPDSELSSSDQKLDNLVLNYSSTQTSSP